MANQDISVFDKNNPVLGATAKAQDMSRLNKHVVPVGAFTDPHNPYTQSLSVNLPLDDAPLRHSEDYAKDVLPGKHLDRTNTMSAGAKTLTGEDKAALDVPEDRDDWTKAHWQRAAKHYGLPTSGNMDTIRGRVEKHEDEQAEAEKENEEALATVKDWKAEDWKNAVDEAEDEEDLAELRSLYGKSGADFVTVEQAFEEKSNNLSEQS